MGKVTKFAADARKKAEGMKDQIEGYIETAKRIVDEDTRSSEIFTQTVKVGTKIAGKLLGADVTAHPYFAYHKEHLEILASVMEASDTVRNAMEAWNKAVDAASLSGQIASSLDNMKRRLKGLQTKYSLHVMTSVALLDDMKNGKVLEVFKQLQDAGSNPGQLIVDYAMEIYEVQAYACELYFDAVGLWGMVETEYRVTAAAMQKYEEKQKKLAESTKTIDRVASLALEKQRQEEMFWKTEIEKKKTPQVAAFNPVNYARDKATDTKAFAVQMGKLCRTALSQDIFNPAKMSAAF